MIFYFLTARSVLVHNEAHVKMGGVSPILGQAAPLRNKIPCVPLAMLGDCVLAEFCACFAGLP